MSLVSTYVKYGDYWLKNPTFYNDDLFVCFDDREPAEVVVKWGAFQGNKAHVEFLRSQGFDVRALSDKSRRWYRSFPPKNRMVDARSFFLRWKGSIDPSKNTMTIRMDDRLEALPKGDLVYYP